MPGFLDELRAQYNKEFEIKSMLDNKANSIISMSGTIATLFMGFGSFLLIKIEPSKYEILIPASIFLMTEVVLTTFTIWYSTNSYRLREYRYVMGHERFFEKKSGVFKEYEAEQFKKSTEEKFEDLMIEVYLKTIKENAEKNEDKANKIDHAQKLFSFALTMIPIFAFVIIMAKFIP
jgi:hypothetical protein